MPHRSRLFAIAAFLLVAVLSGCTLSMAGEAPLPTPIPTGYLPTVIALTARALASPTPRLAATAPPPTQAPSPAPAPAGSPTPTPYPIALPTLTPTPPPPLETSGSGYAPLQILYPGTDSRVTSPMRVRLAVQGRYTDAIRVELLGEDGRLIYRKIIRLIEDQPPHSLLFLNLEIPFELRAEAEVGRLQVSTRDDLKRPRFQNAITLTLLKEGQAQINNSASDRSPILLKHPQPHQNIHGGQLFVVGKALPTGNHMVEIRLLDKNGKVLLYQTAPLATTSQDGYGRFAVAIPYKVTSPTRVLLVIQENGDVPPGVAFLASVPLTLSP